MDQALAAAYAMRQIGINTTLADGNEKLDKQLKYADKRGIQYALIIGPEEVKAGKVTLKNLAKKAQETLTLEEAIHKVQNG